MSSRYTQIKTSATNFILAHNPSPQNTPQTSLLASLVTPTFTITFSPSYFVSTRPPLQHALTFDGFIAHQLKMTPLLEKWEVRVKDCFVDGERGVAVVGSEFFMTPRAGEGETVVNEIMWVLEVGEEGLVGRATEWVDGVAAGRLGEIFARAGGA